MRSKASIKGHPIHPILVAFPIAFFIGALAFDVLGWFFENDSFHITALYLVIAGLLSGLVAAVPGFIDFLFTVPPESSARRRAATHGLLNVAIMLLFVAVLFYRVKAEHVSLPLLISLEVVGSILLGISGWLGGELISRNQISVDPRYAGEGKWKEEFITPQNGLIEAGRVDELEVNQMKLVHVSGKRIVLARTEAGYVAFGDHCSHRGGSLAGGAMICDTVQCPWHGSQFNVKTGEVKAGPAKEKISVYTLKERNGKLYLAVNALF